jgi:hypothetical protein
VFLQDCLDSLAFLCWAPLPITTTELQPIKASLKARIVILDSFWLDSTALIL